MIPYQELRIGNYVLADGAMRRISMIDQRNGRAAVDQQEAGAGQEFAYDHIQPVSLTDEVLQQCGFVYHDYFKFWQLIEGAGNTRSEMDIDPDYNLIDFMRRAVVKKIGTLHQLQNLYFQLKGKELAIH
jgi:hypothetical protein